MKSFEIMSGDCANILLKMKGEPLNEIIVISEINPSFKEWWFFDTNCLSELIKQYGSNFSERIENFIENKYILISGSNLIELKECHDLFEQLPRTLSKANAYIIPDTSIYWRSEIQNFLKISDSNYDIPHLIRLDVKFLRQAITDPNFQKVCNEGRLQRQEWQEGIKVDLGQNIDERELGAVIWYRVNKYAQEWFDTKIQPESCNPINFPSFYSFFYTYYFRYMKNKAVPAPNDFEDISSAYILPYCEKYFGERKFTEIFKAIKVHCPPSSYRLSKKLFKKGLITHEEFKKQRRKRITLKLDAEYPLCPNVEIFNYSEMIKILKEFES